jgi:Na+/alanine symporter
MRVLSKVLAALTALSIIAAPAVAQSVQAANAARSSQADEDENKAQGGTGIIIAVISAAAVVGGIAIGADDSGDEPTSP